ncbi:hypothetical protein A5756_10510 [Mycobacterium sp. 852002-53434_SCH5985345]|uniref:hypothetical protein n=1 Tax=Mycobacterium sp. 852002-53434_SCH5985345 TaxID=1834107 RepID=UPI0007FB91FE|nr:hypothetical protein [Mycobacterium sp. 852002-53434_SCH5985345]OBF56717.1 hypothetical protein A5756_10510 [Mycobacterium sp. 852002-53434_SCH5985345]
MLNLIAETNGTRAAYQVMNEDCTIDDMHDDNVITLPVIAWDKEGFALVADAELGRLVRAGDAIVHEDGVTKPCTFVGFERHSSATGPLAW